ncbi:MAG: tyrosine-type recombinase/integrase [Clostridia bacterium]|nr:tyrosine-type recombinase/integrase [Clostridia bacterium]
MKEFDNYFKERNYKITKKTQQLLTELPFFCNEFFRGIENQTTPLTQFNYAQDLKIFFNFLTTEIIEFNNISIKDFSLKNLAEVTATHIEIFLNYLSGYFINENYITNNEKGKARKLATIRSLLKYFYKKDKIPSNVSNKIDTPKIHEKEIVRLEVDEVVKLINQTENPVNLTKRQYSYNKITQKRDTALLSLLLGTGIRVSECVGINLEDIDFKVNGLRITRKGGNQVVLYFSDEVAKELISYISEREKNPNIPQNEKALFLSIQNKRIGVRAVEKLVKKYSQAVIPLKNITPHKLRSTYGTNLYRETNDIYIVADVLGHKDVNTTRKHYAAISEDARRSVANKVKLRED